MGPGTVALGVKQIRNFAIVFNQVISVFVQYRYCRAKAKLIEKFDNALKKCLHDM